MDCDRFDALARLLATSGSRRAALGALLGAGLLGHDSNALAKPGKGKRKNRGKNRGRRKKRGRNGPGGDPTPDPPVESACGTRHCDPPEPGSTRSGCEFNRFNGASFAGQDFNGSIFRRIDGRGTNVNDTDNHGSVFAEACLRSATFRGARLGGSTWSGACLVDADFTGADLGRDADALNGALLCHTIMPDGSRNDRDCGVDTALCRSSAGGIGPLPCTVATIHLDCPERPCRTMACTNGVCTYEAVPDGPSPPNQLCEIFGNPGLCCSGVCCGPLDVACNPAGVCCAPTCSGRNCGPDGCERGGTCGTCGAGRVSDEGAGRCVCTAETCPTGCCGDSRCQPGNTTQFCGRDGAVCELCHPGESCNDSRCTCSPQSCPTGQVCSGGRCVCTPQSCPNGCCADEPGGLLGCRPGTANANCGRPGERCVACGDGQVCRDGRCRCTGSQGCGAGQECVDGACVCTPQLCPFGCCANGPGSPGDCLPGDGPRACGRDGARCAICAPFQNCRQGRCQRQQG